MANIQRGGFGIKVSKRCLFDPVTGVSVESFVLSSSLSKERRRGWL